MNTPEVPGSSPFAFEKEGKMKDTEMGQKACNVLTERYENLDVSLQVVQADIQHSKSLKNPELDQLLLKQKTEITDDLKEVTNELEEYSPDYKEFRDEVHKGLDPNVILASREHMRQNFEALVQRFAKLKASQESQAERGKDSMLGMMRVRLRPRWSTEIGQIVSELSQFIETTDTGTQNYLLWKEGVHDQLTGLGKPKRWGSDQVVQFEDMLQQWLAVWTDLSSEIMLPDIKELRIPRM
ncbi:hypothetical protein CVT24_001359 [Panaeolus cyanescens]|uniref:Uncharacterized protein n=1 Tax=Panaeolus cyanescens TaxID=181874 RepID=A0A409YFV2_9AGAR|nr:hypothetical protein CVT24_001359 [Panaeolus cyanescens]